MSVPPTGAPRRLDWAKRIRDGAEHAAAVFTDLPGDVQQSDEVEVLFTLIAERYERRSTILTATSPSASGIASSRTR
jgi:hypothetical protein